MSRKPRLYLPDQPQHLVVRGHNRDTVLVREGDFRYLYKCLRSAADHYELAVHAWVFMHNHLHLLVTPNNAQSLPKTMQSVGRRYAQYFNRSYHRSGALWEGRYKCSLVDTEPYLLECYRYIELNPVRAGIVKRPEDYAYSSYHANALGKMDVMLTPHPVFLDFIGFVEKVSESKTTDSNTGELDEEGVASVSRNCYRELCAEILDGETLTDIRRGTQKGSGIGRSDFLQKVARLCE